MEIRLLGPGDEKIVISGSELFDDPPTGEWTRAFLEKNDHHLLMALTEDGPVGFVTGVETVHPDKGTEMFLYELSVHPGHRRRGVGSALVRELAELARRRGCYGMWVLIEADDAIALATYRSAGSSAPEPALVVDWVFTEPDTPNPLASN